MILRGELFCTALRAWPWTAAILKQRFRACELFIFQSYYFDRDDVALKNFAKYFLHQSHEEREHAEKLMKLQNQRGGRIFLQDIKVSWKGMNFPLSPSQKEQ